MSTRIALVGAGSVARRHVEVLTGLGARVVGVVDPVEEAAQRLARECDAPTFSSTTELLERGRPDAVYVCVPPFAHGEPERAALARGLPLFVEKPIGVDLAEAEVLAAEIDRAGLVTGTGYHWRCLDLVTLARERLADAPALLASGYWLDKRPPVAWWGWRERSGGQVVEQLTHVLDLARVLLGEVTEVYAAGARRRETSGPVTGDTDDATAATLRFASGAVATLAATSTLSVRHRAALHLFAPGLVAEVSETCLALDDGAGRRVHEPAEDPRITVDREFLEAVRGERSGTRAPYSEALRTHRLGCAVAASAREGRPVRIAPGPLPGPVA